MLIEDDKAEHVVPFIHDQLKAHQTRNPQTPFFIGLNGVQGAGKSVLVEILRSTLQSPPHNLSTVVFSLDDLYLTHADQVALAKANPNNPLLHHRGQPSTHDIPLALKTFRGLKEGRPTKIPRYNKAAFDGQGDREADASWEIVNSDPSSPVRVVLFEGWCVGFRPLTTAKLNEKHAAARKQLQDDPSSYRGRLGHNSLESVITINEALRAYDEITDQFNAFIHIDAADPQFVYRWRLQQEAGLRAQKGSGMTDEQVKQFVDGYYPAYELYTDTLRQGVFKNATMNGNEQQQKGQLRLVVGEDRKVKEMIHI